MGKALSYRQLQTMSDAEVIKLYDDEAEGTAFGTRDYLDEIARRAEARQTRVIARLTWVITGLTLVIAALTAVNVWAVLRL